LVSTSEMKSSSHFVSIPGLALLNHRGIVKLLLPPIQGQMSIEPLSNFPYGARRHPLDSWTSGAVGILFL